MLAPHGCQPVLAVASPFACSHMPAYPTISPSSQRDVRAHRPRGLRAQPFVERHPGAARERHVLVALRADGVVGRAQQLALDATISIPAGRERRRLGADRPRLLELVVDLVQPDATSERNRALVRSVHVRDDPLHARATAHARSGARATPGPTPCPRGLRQHARIDEREAAERRELSATAADGTAVDAGEDQHAVGVRPRDDSCSGVMGSSGSTRDLIAAHASSPCSSSSTTLDANAHGIGPCIVSARERVS